MRLLPFLLISFCLVTVAAVAEDVPVDQKEVDKVIEAYNKKVEDRYGRIDPQLKIDDWIRQSNERKELLKFLDNPDTERDQLERLIR